MGPPVAIGDKTVALAALEDSRSGILHPKTQTTQADEAPVPGHAQQSKECGRRKWVSLDEDAASLGTKGLIPAWGLSGLRAAQPRANTVMRRFSASRVSTTTSSTPRACPELGGLSLTLAWHAQGDLDLRIRRRAESLQLH
jgi:hypothetical protein